MTNDLTQQRITQGGRLHVCSTCARTNDNWFVIPVDGTADAAYRCPEPDCTGSFIAPLRVVAKRSEATGGPEFRQ